MTECIRAALLTGGSDRPYALGLTAALTERGVRVDFIGSDELDTPEVTTNPNVLFLNLRGDQDQDAPLLQKSIRLLRYYARLLRYGAVAEPRVFHILWNNRIELFDRTALMVFYRLMGRRVVLTAHNINAAKRDKRDSWINRLSLRVQYKLCDHIFVHTARMKDELFSDFGVPSERVSVVPFGLNDTVPSTALTASEARKNLGVVDDERVLLFFGQIAPYKGLDILIDALAILAQSGQRIRVIIAGKVKRGWEGHWGDVQRAISHAGIRESVIEQVRFIPDEEVEVYFKAADAVVIPYTDIFQSGVPFLAYNFGLPVIATDVGSLREVVVEGSNGLLCEPRNPQALARAIESYFTSDLYRELSSRREEIRALAERLYGWRTVGEITSTVYMELSAGLCREAVGVPRP